MGLRGLQGQSKSLEYLDVARRRALILSSLDEYWCMLEWFSFVDPFFWCEGGVDHLSHNLRPPFLTENRLDAILGVALWKTGRMGLD